MKGWSKINDVCIGAGGSTDAKGYHPEYTVFKIREGDWEAWRLKECLAMNLPSRDAGMKICRKDWDKRNDTKAVQGTLL